MPADQKGTGEPQTVGVISGRSGDDVMARGGTAGPRDRGTVGLRNPTEGQWLIRSGDPCLKRHLVRFPQQSLDSTNPYGSFRVSRYCLEAFCQALGSLESGTPDHTLKRALGPIEPSSTTMATATANHKAPDETTALSTQYETPMGLAHTTMQALKDRIKLHYDLASDYYLSLW